ncbi:hypothetical protein GCM10022255_112520 [Dactylosporangium darangshiense]|uniref:Uncharacterized protein n=1 Tax=Dactylosporangium darangshiense TaxID=579108 RepID=A0ABP8DW29_9ACTN
MALPVDGGNGDGERFPGHEQFGDVDPDGDGVVGPDVDGAGGEDAGEFVECGGVALQVAVPVATLRSSGLSMITSGRVAPTIGTVASP